MQTRCQTLIQTQTQTISQVQTGSEAHYLQLSISDFNKVYCAFNNWRINKLLNKTEPDENFPNLIEIFFTVGEKF